MKGYLYSNKGIFQLGPKVTSIGLIGCNLTLKHPTVEDQHAIIEFTNDDVSEGFYTILDFGSRHGTYINGNCINPNTATLLDNHSTLQFGSDPTTFEFVTEATNHINPGSNKRAWNRNDNSYLVQEVGMHLPQLNGNLYTKIKSYSNGYKPPAARTMLPSSNRSRPVSAEMLRRGVPAVSGKYKKQSTGWINASNLMRSSSSSDLQYFEEEESKLEHLEEDMRRLNHIEIDSQKKDIIISRLGHEVNQLKQQMSVTCDNQFFLEKFNYLEKELNLKNEQLATLKEKDQEINTMKNNMQELISINDTNEKHRLNLINEVEELKLSNEKYESKIKALHADKEIFVNDIFTLKSANADFSNSLSNKDHEIHDFKLKITDLSVTNQEIMKEISKLEENNFQLQSDVNENNKRENSLKNELDNILNSNLSSLTELPHFIADLLKDKDSLLFEINNKNDLIRKSEHEISSINRFIDEIACSMESFGLNTDLKGWRHKLEDMLSGESCFSSPFQRLITGLIKFSNFPEDNVANLIEKCCRQSLENNQDIWKLLESKLYLLEDNRQEIDFLKMELEKAEEKFFHETKSLAAKHAEEVQHMQNNDFIVTKDLQDLRIQFDDIAQKSRETETMYIKENSDLKNQLKDVHKLLTEKESLLAQMNYEQLDFAKTLDHFKSKEADLENRLRSLENDDAQKLRIESLELELSERCEQIRQHALTICAMDEQINTAAERANEFKDEITRLKNTISDIKTNNGQLIPMPPSKPRPLVHVATPLVRETTNHIQRENNDLAQKIAEQYDVIQDLRKELSNAQARLSDVHGELSEEQKRYLEESERELRRRDVELIELQQQMLQLTQLVDQLKKKLVDSTHAAERLAGEVAAKTELVKRHEQANGELNGQLNRSQTEAKSKVAALEEQLKLSAELALRGASCKGDRHDVIIGRQREALTEMRAKIRALESGDIPLMSQDEAIQQIAYMRQELEELRSMQASRHKIESSIQPKHLSETLQLSENTYLSLMRGISGCLNLGEVVDGMRPLQNLSAEEQRLMVAQRNRCLAQLVQAIGGLKQRAQCKEELSHRYEVDHKQLRHRSLSNDQIDNSKIIDAKKKSDYKNKSNSIIKPKKKLNDDSCKALFYKNQKLVEGNILVEHHEGIRNVGGHKRNSSRDSRPKKKKVPTATLR